MWAEKDLIQEYSNIICAHILGIINYKQYINSTNEFLSYHEMDERMLIVAYARANAFFLELTQVYQWIQQLEHDKNMNEEVLSGYKQLYFEQLYETVCPQSQKDCGLWKEQ